MALSPKPRCPSCGAPIIWAKTEMGKVLLIDAAPASNGDFVLRGDGAFKTAVKIDFCDTVDLGEPLYRKHVVSCPEANKQRRKP
jgi:endogenous inhibitor of DNA gyrase (YacG/DUF329 family)